MAGIPRAYCYELYHKDDDFMRAWDDAISGACDLLEQEAWRRAVKGTEKPVFHQGEICGGIQEYSDTLLIFLLKGHRPEKYRERYDVKSETKNTGVKKIEEYTNAELEAILRGDL